MKRHAFRLGGLLLCALCVVTPAAAQGTVFLVRHAERADTAAGAAPTMAADPSLSAAGHARSASLAALLRDAGITAIFVTQFKRTSETAAPLAQALSVAPTAIAANDTPALVERLQHLTGNALVVGHSNTVPEIAKALGVTSTVAIKDDEYDNLLIIAPGQPARVVRLHFR